MLPETSVENASFVPPNRKRLFVMVLLFVTMAINYLLPSSLLIATPIVTGSLGTGDSLVPTITYIALLLLIGTLSDAFPIGNFKLIEG